MDSSIQEGVFARKQICSPAWFIAWSHRRRFQTGLELARAFAGQSVVDYGCGDGTFLAMLSACDWKPASAMGVEIDDRLVEDCRRRFADKAGLAFCNLKDMDARTEGAFCDAVICMEVLEHVVDLDAMLARFQKWLKPGGTLLVSVPVETGAPLVIKQAARCVAGWFGIGDYPGTSPYTWSEMWRSLTAGRVQHITRPRHRTSDGFEFHDHKGFNWMALRNRLATQFELQRVAASPFLWLSPHLGSQAWFICRKRA